MERTKVMDNKVEAHIHSLNGELRPVTIVEMKDNNNCIAEYDGKRCTAIFNVFVGRFYVDDKYGVIDNVRESGADTPTIAPRITNKRASRGR